MRCYFLREGHIASVELLTGLSDEEAIAKAHELYRERRAKFEGFEVWDRTRVVTRHPDPDGEKSTPDRLGEEQKRAVTDQNRPPVYLVTLFHKSGNAGEAIKDSVELMILTQRKRRGIG